jgi:hypothetical protein
MATQATRLGRALDWIVYSELKLAQISHAQIMRREDWVVYAGARYPRPSGDSVFITRPWDEGLLTQEQKDVMIKRRRQIILET